MFGSTRSVPPVPEGWNHLAINLSNLALIWSQHSRMSTVSLAGGECAFNCHLPTPGPSVDPFKILLEPPRASIICWHAMTRSGMGGWSGGRASRTLTSESARHRAVAGGLATGSPPAAEDQGPPGANDAPGRELGPGLGVSAAGRSPGLVSRESRAAVRLGQPKRAST
jgi:hypothetical protein